MLYCGSGWRSSLAWLLARLMGHPNVASFDGSLLGWSVDPSRPLERGEPGKARPVDRRAHHGAGAEPRGWTFHAVASADTCDEGPVRVNC